MEWSGYSVVWIDGIGWSRVVWDGMEWSGISIVWIDGIGGVV